MKSVEIAGGDLTPGRLAELPADLESLVIWGGPLRNEDLTPLARFRELRHLALGEMRIDDGVFGYLASLPNLEILNLAYTAVRGDFSALTGLPLREVRLEGCRWVGDHTARSLAAFPTLRNLEIHMTGFTDAGVAALADLPLEVLWLGPRVTDEAMKVLSGMPTLRHLDICAHNVSDEGVRMLAKLPRLEILWLARCEVTDASIDVLASLKSLCELNVNYTGVSSAGLDRVRAALPGCRFPEPD